MQAIKEMNVLSDPCKLICIALQIISKILAFAKERSQFVLIVLLNDKLEFLNESLKRKYSYRKRSENVYNLKPAGEFWSEDWRIAQWFYKLYNEMSCVHRNFQIFEFTFYTFYFSLFQGSRQKRSPPSWFRKLMTPD